METATEPVRADQGGRDPQPGPFLTVTINNVPTSTRQGRQTVAAIKQFGGVPLADDLDHLVDGTVPTEWL